MPLALSKVIVYAGVPIIYEAYSSNHWAIFTRIFEPAEVRANMAAIIEWSESDLLTGIRWALNLHFASWILLWLIQHRVAYRTVPVTIFAWEILVYWIGLGVIGGFMLYRPDQNLAAKLEDDLKEVPPLTMTIFGAVFCLMEAFNLFFHF